MSIDSILHGNNAAFIEGLLDKYQDNPNSVPEDWQQLFKDMGVTGPSKPVWVTQPANQNSTIDFDMDIPLIEAVAKPVADSGQTLDQTQNSIRALMLIRAYRVRGHLEADLDPLGLTPRKPHPELDYKTYGFTEDDLDVSIYLDNVLGLEKPTLRQIVETLKLTYARKVGFEFMHIADPEAKSWLQENIEGTQHHNLFSKEEKERILEELTRAELFESFLHKKYVGTKRFGLDGGESMVPALEECIRTAAKYGVIDIVFGMAHRGRLNVLTNILGKSFTAMFAEFKGIPSFPDDVQGSGDVKYHLGTSTDRNIDGQSVHMSLTANPSHLEAVDPVVVGKVRAKQVQLEDTERRKSMGILLHGDAAFAGQGIVPETLAMSELKGYRTGGTVHFVINNQIGFTTNPANARSSPYCTDVARMVQSPIFHVNADDPEAVVWVSRLATEYRQRFQKDVVVDVICYRRNGHNEGDEPAFTQPLMYQTIAKHPTTRALYGQELEQHTILKEGRTEQISKNFYEVLEKAFIEADDYRPQKADWLEGAWQGLQQAPTSEERRGKTAVPLKILQEIGLKITETPDNFTEHAKITRQLKAKRKLIEDGKGIDWATAEALAFGSLLKDGHPVRLSGQDVGRGTFSQRHAILYDQKNGKAFIPLNTLSETKGEFINSFLSEYGVLGFEYGFSLAAPKCLTLWEAQFGDFSNGAQIIIDQFISSAESKWLRMSGLVMLLPHGYEGQGPEHSSARLERYLQLCAEDNMQVANCSTPAQYFHILRRQLHRNFRKPLIIVTPKSLLRHKECVSDLSEMAEGSSFHRVLPDNAVNDKEVKRVIFCSGKVYYDLLAARSENNVKDVALVRLEQFNPFPYNSCIAQLKRYPKATIVWCQEEPQNMGAWTFVDRKLEKAMKDAGCKAQRPAYIGRSEAASPATGSLAKHNAEQNALVKTALGIN